MIEHRQDYTRHCNAQAQTSITTATPPLPSLYILVEKDRDCYEIQRKSDQQVHGYRNLTVSPQDMERRNYTTLKIKKT
ncbi:hypothetical protein T4D_3919 [Trichinella pseudospiralis]|uniref:Uncharacterized protein n=1 Tax=Trichinella pseudospiralis TaxID=6337 RepID=A0A0V1G1D0_TRIPS|nr:hypothetical protein T4D_3919 [Trichinella pseudospiralis]